MNITCYVVDDEYYGIQMLEVFINKTPGLELTGKFTNPLNALHEINSGNVPTLLFLDVDMPEISGLDFAGMVKDRVTVIFTTSFREYAPEAFEKEAIDYLLKPISYERFLQAIQKVSKSLLLNHTINEHQPTSIFIKTGIKGQFQQVDIDDISYISSAANYLEIYTSGRKILAYLMMHEIMEKLPDSTFSRIHKSYIVQHKNIRIIEPGQVKLLDDTVLPIGRSYQKDFHHKIHNLKLVSKRGFSI